MKSFLHKLAHLFGSYGGHPVHFTFSALPRAEWYSGFRCGKCGSIFMVQPKKTTQEWDESVMRIWDTTTAEMRKTSRHSNGY